MPNPCCTHRRGRILLVLPLVLLLLGSGSVIDHLWLKSFDAVDARNLECGRIGALSRGVWLSNGLLLSLEEADLVARQPSDGTELWRYQNPDLCIKTVEPAGNDLALLETRRQPGTREHDYFVAILDVMSGKLRWRTQLPDDVWSGTIAVGESTVFALGRSHWDPGEISERTQKMVAPSLRHLPASGFDESIQLHALDRKDGSSRWSAPVASAHEYNPVGDADIALGPGYALVSKNTIYGHWGAELFDTTTGVRRWEIPLGLLGEGKVQIYGNVWRLDETRFAVAYDGTLEHRSLETGDLIKKIGAKWDRPWRLVVRADRLYAYSEGRIDAYSIEDGNRLWGRSLGIKRDWWGGTRRSRHPFISDDRLSVGSDDGCIYVLNTQNGRIQERLDLYLHISDSPAILSGDLIIVDGLGLVAAYEPKSLDCRKWYPF